MRCHHGLEQEQCGCCQRLAILAAQQQADRQAAAAKEKAKADRQATKNAAQAARQARRAAREAKSETRAELARERFAAKAQREYDASRPDADLAEAVPEASVAA